VEKKWKIEKNTLSSDFHGSHHFAPHHFAFSLKLESFRMILALKVLRNGTVPCIKNVQK